jgi:hypothetical protein
MSINRSRATLLALLALCSGCASRSETPTSQRSFATPEIIVVVTNRTSTDMDVYATPASGPPQWLGVALHDRASTLTMVPIGAGSRTLFVAQSVVEGTTIRTNTVAVSAGDRIEFTLLGPLMRSTATVKH